jgi:hypothetical protein
MGGKIALRAACLAQGRVTHFAGFLPFRAATVPFGADVLAFFRSSVDSVEARQEMIAHRALPPN